MHTTERGGRARVLLAGVVVALVLVALLLRFASAPGQSPTAALPPQVPAPEAGSGPGPAALTPTRETAPADAPPPAPDATTEDRRSPGTIEVSLTGRPAGAAPETVVEASRWRSHPGAAVVVEGRLVIPAGSDRGLLRLELGSYALVARARGWTSAVARADIDDAAPSTAVELVMTGCAALRGYVLDASGEPVPDLAVHVTDERGQLIESEATVFGGGFELPCVPPGTVYLVVGNPQGPVLGPLEVQVAPEGSTLADVVLPPVAAVEILVVDETGAPVPDVELDGRGETGGQLHLVTDFDGRATSELALPGLWRFFADSEALGRGNAVLEVEAGGRAQATLTLRRSR